MQKIPTRKDDLVEKLHGKDVADPYRWLEGDPSEPELNAWLTAQGAAARSYFDGTKGRDALRDEFKKLFERDSVDVPMPRRGRYFFEKRKADEDMAILYMSEGLDGTPRKLIDPNTLSPDKTTVLADWEPTRDGRRLMYALSKSGNDKNDIRVMDVDAGEDLPEVIPDDLYPELDVWNEDGTGFWYERRDPDAPENEPKFHKRVYFHRIGDDVANDTYVWGKGFPKEGIPSIRLSHCGKYLIASVYAQDADREWTETYIKETKDTEGEFVLALEREPGSLHGASVHQDFLYVSTNQGAPKWKLVRAPVADVLAGTAVFTDVLPEAEDTLEEYAPVGDRLFVTYLHDVHTLMREYALDGTFVRDITLPALGSAGGFSREAEGKELFYLCTSFAYPPTVFRLDLESGETRIIDQIKSTYDVDTLMTEQVWCTSKDGTRVPMFLIYKKGVALDGKNPAMLYGYGGFDISLTPSYMLTSIPFIMRGGVFAIANLRGGGEFGKDWHEAGMKDRKQNVFDDFIAASEYLIKEKYTSSDRLAVMGGSNGGLLVAALMTQRPELVRAVVSRVPVTDMLRFHLHHGGRHWIPDYGDPDDPTMFEYLLGYSPYHNVKDGERYPATLVTTSDGDDRVHPLHAYKFAARVQEANASEHPILMRVEMQAGHSGAYAISRSVEEDADVWSFVFRELGMLG